VSSTILNRWNFRVIANGHDFAQSVLRGGNATIYALSTDSDVFHRTLPALSDTLQHGRLLGESLLANPTSANGDGPIYFYLASAGSGLIYTLCNDAVDVNLLTNSVTYGNKYYSPWSNPNTWDTQTIRDAYEADDSDSLDWE